MKGITGKNWLVISNRFLPIVRISSMTFLLKTKSIEEIQDKYQYSSKHNAQNQKYKCRADQKIKNKNIFTTEKQIVI